MDSSLPLVFRVFQIIVPTFAVLIICTGLCRCFFHTRRRRQEQQLASARAQVNHSSVYIIPISPSDEQYSPPRYSVVQRYTPPPAYDELVAKPDPPLGAPPAYSEAVGHEFISSEPDRSTPSCPALSE